jgi:ribonucleoside-diphosphate reductase alpha chain
MQLTAEHASNRSPSASPDQIQLDESMASHVSHADYKIIRRNGAVVAFEPAKISIAMTKAFLAVNGGQGAASARVREQVAVLTASVVNALVRRLPHGGTFHIEDIQDQVELALMRSAEHDVARAYVLYREKRSRRTCAEAAAVERRPNSRCCMWSMATSHAARPRRPAHADPGQLRKSGRRRVGEHHLRRHADQSVRRRAGRRSAQVGHPGRPLADRERPGLRLRDRPPAAAHHPRRSAGRGNVAGRMATALRRVLPAYIKLGIEAELLDAKLAQFDLAKLGAALDHRNDLRFNYLGLQTLYDRYFLHIRDRRIELPQVFFMRVAMGLAMNEINREARAIEFYSCCPASTS